MVQVRSLLILGLIGCGGPRTEEVFSEVLIDDYTGLNTEGLSWTYRDDGETETSPDNDRLIRSRHVGGGELDFRRGSRWADAEAAGSVRFAQSDRVRIVSWNLNGVTGSGDFPLGRNKPKEGDELTADGWMCVVDIPASIETYYGTYTEVLSFLCDGDDGPTGDWHFAKDVGLVAYEGDDYSMSLVAPW